MKGFKLLGTTVLQSAIFTSALVLAAPAMAQDAPAEQAPLPETAQAEDVPTAPQPANQEGEESTIVVIGSRIRTVNEFNSPDPVTVIDPALSAREGKLDTAATLQSSPIAAGSTQITAAISSNFVTNGGPGAQTIDLRGLGANRTLVLLNGRRAGPAGTRGGVSSFDLNVLPQSIAQNVQILKTGASSVYGSDAVAGVVNIITKTDMDGLELDMSSSVPFDSGGEQYRISAIWGKKFDRGHILIAGDYFKQKELARGDRSYLTCPESYVFDPDTGERADLIDPRTGSPKCEDLPWGHVWTYNLIDNLFLDGPGGPDTGPNTSIGGGSVLVQYQYPGETLGIPAYGAPSFPGDFGTPAGFFPTGYDAPSLAVQNSIHPYVLEQTLIPKTERYTLYADASYEITDNIEAFGEFLFNRRKTYQNGWRQIWNFGYTDCLYGAAYQSYCGFNFWAPGWEGVNLVSPTPITNHSDSSQKVDYYRGVGGFRGDFGGFMSGWSFDSYVSYSYNKGRYRTEQFLQDVYDSGYFQTSSCVGTVLPVSGKQCIDLPWTDPDFLWGRFTPEQVDFMFDWEEGKTIYKQLVGEFSVNGPLFELPGGTASLALGATARRDEIEDTPGEITMAGNAWGTSTSGITAGHSITKEAFGEINLPVLRDRPFFKDLTFSGAARITSVKATRESDGFSDSSNGNWTYKLGANWAVNDWVRFRGTYGTSYRAPALFEQFLADETSFPSQRAVDPCIQWAFNLAQGNISQRIADNCAADGIPGNHSGAGVSATSIASGGIGVLEPETSKAYTASIILSPRFDFLPNTRFDLAVDYFHIKVTGEIDQLGARNILVGCYESVDFPNDPLCDLFTRGQPASPNNVNTITDKFINIASQTNAGVDVTANIRHDLGNLGTLNFLASMTFQTKDDITLLPGSPMESDNGEAGSPKWVGDFNLTWQPPGGWTIFYGIDVIGKTSNVDEVLEDSGDLCFEQGIDTLRPDYCLDVTAPMKWYHNVSVSKEINKDFEMTVGITNLFDTRPPRVSTLQTGASNIALIGPVVAASQYDFLGRRLFVHVKRKF